MKKKYKNGGHKTIYVDKTKWQQLIALFKGKKLYMSEYIDDKLQEQLIRDWIDQQK